MPDSIARYAELGKTTRAFLENLGEQDIVRLAELITLYNDLTLPRNGGKITPLDFLKGAKPRTLEWLLDARKEEIDQLDEAIRLVRSGRTVGRFMRWVVITTIGAFIVMSQFGEAITKVLSLFGVLKGGNK